MKAANFFSNQDLFSRLLELELKRSLRYQSFISILLVEAHAGGTEDGENHPLVSGKLALLIGEQLRETDLIGTYNENVLSVVLLHSDKTMAHRVAQRLGILMSQYFGTSTSQGHFSIGGACFPSNATDLSSLYQTAFIMLSEARSAGATEIHFSV